MKQRATRLHRLTFHLAVAFAALVASVGFWSLQSALLSTCGVSNESCATVSDFEKHDPFCIIDPTCVSPFYSPAAEGEQHWMGAEGWNLGTGQLPPGDSNFFAIPNYLLFLAIVLLMAVFVVGKTQASKRRRIVMNFMFVWVGTVVLSWWWFVPLGLFGRKLSVAALLEACATFIVTLGAVGLAARWASRERQAKP